MKRMYSRDELLQFVKENGDSIVEALKGKDLSIEGLTSKGIANTGNIANIGDIATTGKLSGGEIVENMSGYSFVEGSISGLTIETDYAGVVKNGNKLTFVQALKITKGANATLYGVIGEFSIPETIGAKLFPNGVDSSTLDIKQCWSYKDINGVQGSTLYVKVRKGSNTKLDFYVVQGLTPYTEDTPYYVRVEVTFLLSENIAPQE